MSELASQKRTKRLKIILACIVLLGIIINVVMFNFLQVVLDMYFGKGDIQITTVANTSSWDTDYYKSDYPSLEDLKVASIETAEQVEAEGAVLLKNDSQALPLMKNAGVIDNDNRANVTLFGRTSVDPIYSGAGSAQVSSESDNFKTAFEGNGFNINPVIYDFYSQHDKSVKKQTAVVGGQEAEYTGRGFVSQMGEAAFLGDIIAEVPVEDYTEAVEESYEEYSDAAIIVIGRVGGEGCDLPTDMTDYANYEYDKSKHYLQLNQDEINMLKHVKEEKDKGVFKKVVVLLNTVNAIESDFLNNPEYGIDAALWIGSYGNHGLNAVAQIINGSVNPSGRLVDTFVSDLKEDPTYQNFGDTYYTNVDGSIRQNESGSFVAYEEGIYVGYRYYETAAAEAIAGNYEGFDYDQTVVYPFGYGLSYTQFDQVFEGTPVREDDQFVFDVKVTNTGEVSGKDVVQLYVEQPYWSGGIEKSKVVLIGFSKTSLLESGKSETLKIKVPIEDLASYDYLNHKVYVLDKGLYQFYLSDNAHSWESIDTTDADHYYGVELQEIIYNEDHKRASDAVVATNQFDDVSAHFSNENNETHSQVMSRSNFKGTFPTAPTEADKIASESVKKQLETVFDPTNDFQLGNQASSLIYEAGEVETGLDNGINLIDLRGKDFDDPLWTELLNQLTVEEMTHLIANAGFNTAEINQISKPATLDYDGPLGWSTWVTANGDDAIVEAFPAGEILAATWNVDLAFDMGQIIGEQGLANGFNGWYAPAMNIHRSAFSGRNYEYYSEDGFISGKIAAKTVSGAMDKGVYVYLKHFALNDQEDGRRGIATWADEQAIREIYLRPFEISIKEAKADITYIADDEGNRVTKSIPAVTGIMSSYNCIGTTWAGGNYALLENVLRKEWQFEGAVVTDYYGGDAFMSPDQALRAGSDLMLNTFANAGLKDAKSSTALSSLKNAMHHVLYMVVNSNAMQGIATGTLVTYKISPWKKWLIIGDIAALILIGIAYYSLSRSRKSKQK